MQDLTETTKYGAEPINLGFIDLCPAEMMFWMYCPIKEPFYKHCIIPANLEQFKSIINTAMYDTPYDLWETSYVYITAKTLYVTDGHIGNRPGWHSDGFQTSDVNYIWYDRAPTEFLIGSFELTSDCEKSMSEMNDVVGDCSLVTYPCKNLLKLDQRMIHRSPENFEAGMRTFVKISISRFPYDLEGNSINPHLGEIFDKKPRKANRNHPSSMIL